ncbi:trypsin-like isoform X2 [Pieris brassicae]|uniref:trypsin-like isoform X2 n=1 Tax=Pieris brassicae TaxID=7116 RepID=UPI001E65EDB2|nr:trypsin-like isoform X2 [Pieris brassicae]
MLCRRLIVLLVFIVCSLGQDYEYTGLLNIECMQQYYRIYITRTIPPRTYYYHHEVLAADTYSRYYDFDGSVDIGWRIVGGQLVDIKEVPYQVLYGKYCGGTLIAPEWVITAAHCKEKAEFVYVGSTQRSQATPYKICAHYTHPLWNQSKLHTHDYDYQLILLEKAVPVTATTRPIAIGNIGDVRPGVMIGISGWGHLSYSKKSRMQDYLRRVFVPVMADELCKEMPDGNYNMITPRMFCAGYINGTKDSCQGDSGGPAVVNAKLVGIVSYGVGCAGAGHPGVYSLVPVARQWIRSVTGLPL